MNNTISFPTIPADWIIHSGVQLAGNGFITHVQAVLHKCSGYYPFVVHTAYEHGGEWSYGHGTYCMTLAEGTAAFAERRK